MKPFPNRNEIRAKQISYNKILSEAWYQKKLNNHIYFQQEKLVRFEFALRNILKNNFLNFKRN